MKQLKLRKFPVKSISNDAWNEKNTIIIIGRRETGKTTLAVDILDTVRHKVQKCLVINTNENEKVYSTILPKGFVSALNDQAIENIDPEKSALVLLDGYFHNSHKIVPFGHKNIKTVITQSYAYSFGPYYKKNISHVFILRELDYRNRLLIWEKYAPMFKSFEEFECVLDNTTEHHECLVLVQGMPKEAPLESKVFWYKARDADRIKLERIDHVIIPKIQSHIRRFLQFRRNFLPPRGYEFLKAKKSFDSRASSL